MRIFSFIFLLFVFINTNTIIAQESHDFEISKNLDIYTSLIQQLDLHYVDEIEPGTLSKAAIDAMLKQIDPYTVYYPESEIEDVRFMQTGKYGGVGTTVHFKNNEIVVGAVYPGFPFYKAGIRAGDILLKVDGENISGKNMSQISDKMRGASGTDVDVVYRKSKTKEEVSVVLKREEIKMKDVPYFGILQDSIGYIKLSSFRKTATKEIAEALDSMSRYNGLNSLVFDLRGNGGGLLIEAVKIMDLFVGAKELIVSTKGKTKSESHNYFTRTKALYPNMRIVVLVDNNSASASEIVSGSFQDLDRGVIMGQKTFGKGLVQKVFTLSYRSQAKITVAKYYIPSGRCIQSLDYQHKDATGHAIKTPDSLMTIFKTRNGRMVKDAGGVIPDVVLEQINYDELIFALMKQYMIFDFATNYVNTHDSVADIDKLIIDDNVYNSFLSFVNADSFVFDTNIERELNHFAKMAKDEGYDLNDNIDVIKIKIDIEKSSQYEKNKELIKSYIYQEIASRYAYDSGRVYIALKNDAEVKQAIKLLNNTVKYDNILRIEQ